VSREVSQIEHESFATRWAACYPRLRAYVLLFVSPQHDAEDVIQETALAAAKDFDRYDPTRPFLDWVIGIARNRIREHYQRRDRRKRMVFDSGAVAAIEDAYQSMADGLDDVRDGLDFCLGRLPRRARQLVEYRYLQSLTPEEIAKHLGITTASVYTRLSQIRSVLRECVLRRLRQVEGNS
jgi:RNA polymerase sigma-70 factor (ECF subfamily)